MGRFAGAARSHDEEMGNLCNTVDILDRKFHNHREAAGIEKRRREAIEDGRETMDKLVLPRAERISELEVG